MITFLQVAFVLVLIIIIAKFVFSPRPSAHLPIPAHFYDLLNDYVRFYRELDEEAQRIFLDKFRSVLSAIRITGVNAEVEDLDRVLIAAGAVIPTFYIRDWEYTNLREVLVYPGHFNNDFDQQGVDRTYAGMVGTGALQNVMILSKWELRQGFIHAEGNRNAAIHEFVHLVDKMDGTLDGVPEIILERRYVPQWQQMMQSGMQQILSGYSDIDPYGATSPVEFFAVASEYFFTQPERFATAHPQLSGMLKKIFRHPG